MTNTDAADKQKNTNISVEMIRCFHRCFWVFFGINAILEKIFKGITINKAINRIEVKPRTISAHIEPSLVS